MASILAFILINCLVAISFASTPSVVEPSGPDAEAADSARRSGAVAMMRVFATSLGLGMLAWGIYVFQWELAAIFSYLGWAIGLGIGRRFAPH